jgi:HK97 family phage major capsid protein
VPAHTIRSLKEDASHELREARRIREDAENNGGLTPEKRQQIQARMDRIDDLKGQWELMEREEGYATSLADDVSDDTDETIVETRSASIEERRAGGTPLPQQDVDQTRDGWEGAAQVRDDYSYTRTLDQQTQSELYNRAFYGYMRQRGLSQDGRGALNQVRTMVEGVDADGGYLAPTQLVAGIQYIAQDYQELSPSMTQINTSARSLTFTKGDDTVVMGWVAELGTKPEDQLTFSRTVLVPHVGAVVVWVSDELLEDEQFGLQNYISTRVAEAKVLLEEEAFISGSGSGRPWGLLTRLNGMAGTPQRFTTDGAAITGDDLVNLVYSQPRRYRANSSFVMGTEAIRLIRLLKDGGASGNYLWQPGLQAGEPQTILGYPVREVDAADLNSGVATDDDVAIFGDLRQYMVMRRLGLQVKRLEELRALTDEVGFRFRFRVGGDTINNAAFKTLRIGS